MPRFPNWLSPAGFAGIVLLFAFPFVALTCEGERAASFTGVQLVTGTTVDQSNLGRGQAEPVGGRLWARVALACAVFGAALGFVKTRLGARGPAAAGAAGAISLLLLRVSVNADVLRQGEGMLRTRYALAFWLAMLLFVGLAVLHGATLARERDGRGGELR